MKLFHRRRRTVIVACSRSHSGLGVCLCGHQHRPGQQRWCRIRDDQRVHDQRSCLHAERDNAHEPRPGRVHDRARLRRPPSRRSSQPVGRGTVRERSWQRHLQYDLASGDRCRSDAAYGRRDAVVERRLLARASIEWMARPQVAPSARPAGHRCLRTRGQRSSSLSRLRSRCRLVARRAARARRLHVVRHRRWHEHAARTAP